MPCRDEALVVVRKLQNLAALRWPPLAAGEQHRVLVVDDGSEDGTRATAEAFLAEASHTLPRHVHFETTHNAVRPGKTGALEHGLGLLGGGVDLIALTDADVVLDPEALVVMERAFRRRAELGMASGAQRFVRDLAEDGAARGADGGPAVPAAGLFDRLTAAVRRAESRSGRLFSVHGQLLVWRAELALRPAAGVAADDIDLMLQARRAGRRVELEPAALFYEVKTPDAGSWSARPSANSQPVRRARAYVQVVRHHRRPLQGNALDAVQWAFYRYVPLAAPWASVALLLGLPACAWLAAGLWPALGTAAALLAALLATTPGRRLVRLLRIIARAVDLERREPMSDHWEMARS